MPSTHATRTVATVGILQISTTQNRIELIEAEIGRIGAKLTGWTDPLGRTTQRATGGYRDQLLSNLAQEREALRYWTALQGEQLAIVIRTPEGSGRCS
ncbi:hypothetical protein HQQ81_14095 [Microbacteriaceae bacterium VKM Ac-2854]|nr:hypothetical protein [Microbacteriaceae bacterium VKM Ac-2854]